MGNDYYNCKNEGWNGESNDYGYAGNVIFMLEGGDTKEDKKSEKIEQIANNYYPLKRIARREPILIANTFAFF